MRKYRYICFIIISSIIFAINISSGEKKIIVTGKSSLSNLDIEKARDRALDDALRKAVEQVVGIQISSTSVTENYKLIFDKILTNSYGYVKNYKILEEKKENDFFAVKVSVWISDEDIRNDLMAIGLLMARKNLPRVMILIKERILQNYPRSLEKKNYFLKQSQTEAAIASILIKKGFYVVDKKVIDNSRKKQQALKALQGDHKAASILGNLFNADIVLIGDVFCKKSVKISNSNFVSVGTVFTYKIVRSDIGEIVVTDTVNASGAGLNDVVASNNAIERLMHVAGDNIVKEVLDKWTKDVGISHVIQIIVFDIPNFSDLIFLENSLKAWIPGILDLYRRSYEKGAAVLDVNIKNEIEIIADSIQKRKFGRFKVFVTGTSKNVIKLSIQKIQPNKGGCNEE